MYTIIFDINVLTQDHTHKHQPLANRVLLFWEIRRLVKPRLKKSSPCGKLGVREHAAAGNTHESLIRMPLHLLYTYKKFWEELIAYFPLIQHGTQRKRGLQQFFVAGGTPLQICHLSTRKGYTDKPNDPPLIIHGPHKNDASNNSSIVAEGTRLPSRCLATKGGIHFTEPLPSNDRRIHRHTDWWEGFIMYAVEVGSGAMIH
jgi:hypothetical protein